MLSMKDAFPDRGGHICSSLFQATESSTKLWSDINTLCASDATTFWAVVANHHHLPKVLEKCLNAVDRSHGSSSPADRVPMRDQRALGAIYVRMVAQLGKPTASPASTISTESISNRMRQLIPTHHLLPLSLLLQRFDGTAATIALTALVLQCPCHLESLSGAFDAWFDAVSSLASRCLSDAKRGRYQRRAADITSLLEQTVRQCKYVWAAAHSIPYAVYFNTFKGLQGLRVISEVIAPTLLHFIMACEALSPSRPKLTRGVAMIVNAAVNAAVVILLLTPFKLQGNLPPQAVERAYILPKFVASVDQNVIDYLASSTVGGPKVCARSCRKDGLLNLAASLCPLPPPVDLGSLFTSLGEPLSSSKDFACLSDQSARFLEMVLSELVHQHVRMEDLSSKFFTPSAAASLGAPSTPPQEADSRATRRTDDTHEADAPCMSTAVVMVLSVIPNADPKGVEAALRYYNDDVEQLILDAASENLPPHLIDSFHSHFETSAPRPLGTPDDPELHSSAIREAEDIDLFLCGDFTDPPKVDHHHPGDEETTYEEGLAEGMFTLHSDEQSYEMFSVDEEMKEKIRMLSELMYDDELDDTQDIAQGVTGLDLDESDDELSYPPLHAVDAAPSSHPAAPPQGHRGHRTAQPAYTRKPKTITRRAHAGKRRGGLADQ
jgi:hypothetical protein